MDASPTTSVEEYRMPNQTLSGATAIVYGRYPEKGYATNTKSHELALVISGNGFIGTKRKRMAIELGDCILIRPNEQFYWSGNMAIFMVCAPSWKPSQHIVTASKYVAPKRQ